MQFNFLPIEIVFLSLGVFFLVAHLWYTLFIHGKLLKVKSVDLSEKEYKPLSVVISARNEAENLLQFLPSILEQDYPDFEVVVVNDRSWDATEDVLKEMCQKYPHLKMVTIAEGDKFIAGKKFALTMGIKAASHEWLVFTDADCQPASNQWLKHMAPPSHPETSIFLGYSPYFKGKGLLSALIRYETFFTAINYLGFAVAKNPYMGVGRNLAYKKSLFFKGKGFAAHMHVPSGDDDLFVNAHADAHNTAIVTHQNSHVWSIPKDSWRTYFRQKRRHSGAGKLYKSKHKWSLSLQLIFQMCFFIAIACLAFLPNGLYPALTLYFISLLPKVFIYPRLLKRMNYPDLRWCFPFLEILLNVFLIYNGIVAIFVKKASWK